MSRLASRVSDLCFQALDRPESRAITRPLPVAANASARMISGSPSSAEASAQLAQLVEQRIENPRVRGSNPRLGTTHFLCRFKQINTASAAPQKA